MLQIQDIHKKYITGELVQTALDGVSLTLRDNEFVAILGPSGSGKTTLLNVIGGLDRYDSGDLIINGISTKKYSDRDWDSYRNHTVGFVFQSYNLIPHQTVLANVELALTISGISGSERRSRAIAALEAVGLGKQLHKRPNQMSGGQMQRVAIARALVNNPDILLADEPTGALDSETSIQVMELLKEVSKDRLVVMVTHNPELAEVYANRIVRVKDGKILGDTNPYTPDESDLAPARHENMGRASMSLLTALSLSFNNLRTKKGRTLLTAFAGSIGIIGIAMIMALSAGFQRYVDKIQEDTLSSYPLVIRSETASMSSMMASFGQVLANAGSDSDGIVREQPMVSQMFASMGANDLGAFKSHIEDNIDTIGPSIHAVQYSYGIRPYIFSELPDNRINQVNPANLFQKLMNGMPMASFMDMDLFQEMMDNRELLSSQYDVLQGRLPERYDEVVIVLNSPTQMSDYMAYSLGLRDTAPLSQMIQSAIQGDPTPVETEGLEWTYDQLMELKFRLINAPDLYRYREDYGVWEDMSSDAEYMQELISSGEQLSVVGIICPKDGSTGSALSQGIAYTSDLTRHIIQKAEESEIVRRQLADDSTDVFTGIEFGSEEKTELDFEDMIHIDGDMLSSAFGMNISEDAVIQMMEEYIKNAAGSLNIDTTPAQNDFTQTLNDLALSMFTGYITAHADESGSAILNLEDAESIVDEFMASEEASALIGQLSEQYHLPEDPFRRVYRPLLLGAVTGYIAADYAGSILPNTPPPAAQTPQPTDPSAPTETVPPEFPPELPTLPEHITASVSQEQARAFVSKFTSSDIAAAASKAMAAQMVQPQAQKEMVKLVSKFGDHLLKYLSNSFYVDTSKITNAFEFELNEDELMRLMQTLSADNSDHTAASNLLKLGYADPKNPSIISIYFSDFAAKETFLSFLDDYNQTMEQADQEELVINYSDFTGMMMSSVRTIIDSVSYVLIAFVAVSLIVSSIMIGIITYISVMERTKEIGVLRAIGASKHNISQVFNAETFIIGLCSGLIGVGVSLLLIIPCNRIIHSLLGNQDITAHLPIANAAILIVLSMILTLIGGLIPSKKAAQKDPVIALRSE